MTPQEKLNRITYLIALFYNDEIEDECELLNSIQEVLNGSL